MPTAITAHSGTHTWARPGPLMPSSGWSPASATGICPLCPRSSLAAPSPHVLPAPSGPLLRPSAAPASGALQPTVSFAGELCRLRPSDDHESALSSLVSHLLLEENALSTGRTCPGGSQAQKRQTRRRSLEVRKPGSSLGCASEAHSLPPISPPPTCACFMAPAAVSSAVLSAPCYLPCYPPAIST